MSVTPDQASEALRDMERARSRSIAFYSYRVSSPQLILWGIFWMIGYAATDLAPNRSSIIWLGIGALWLILSFALNRRSPQKSGTARNAASWRFAWLYLIFCAFVAATIAIMQPHGNEMGAFVPLLIAAIYATMGLWLGWRYAAIGAGLAVLTIAGYFLLPVHFLLWMGFVGGGALVLTGLWLRRA